jgi:hypothetical protein
MKRVIKCRGMQRLEIADPQQRDIREILGEAIVVGGGLVGGAVLLGLEPSTLSHWIKRLGGKLHREIRFPEYDASRTSSAPQPAEALA